MGIYDRDYSRGDYQPGGPRPQMQFRFPKITPTVKWLLIANIGVFFACIISTSFGGFAYKWFEVLPSGAGAWQFWRYIGYQFLHANGRHIFGNMLGLFFLGPTLERHWGGRKFLWFYLGCGVVGGLFYPILVGLGILGGSVGLVGASGAILGMLAACAILFPKFVVFIVLFPVPIRVAAIGLILVAAATVLSKGANAGGEAAHFGGMVAGALYVFLGPKLKQRSGRTRPPRVDILKKKHI